MVLIVHQGGPSRCRALPVPRPGRLYWEQAIKEQQQRLILPPFSVRTPCRAASVPTLFASLEAGVATDEPGGSLRQLCSLRGLGDDVLQQTRPHPLDASGTPLLPPPTLPSFVLRAVRCPLIEQRLRFSDSATDVPILNGPELNDDGSKASCWVLASLRSNAAWRRSAT